MSTGVPYSCGDYDYGKRLVGHRSCIRSNGKLDNIIWGFFGIRAIARDEGLYPDPLAFKPERWLPGGSSFNSLRPGEYIFGYGRR